jgi:hypothetical protein
VLTDDRPAYRWIGRKFLAHLAVNHSAGGYVRRDPLAATTAYLKYGGELQRLAQAHVERRLALVSDQPLAPLPEPDRVSLEPPWR